MKKFVILAAGLFAAALIVTAARPLFAGETEAAAETFAETSAAPEFMLKSRDGAVIIDSYGSGAAAETDIAVGSLREYDRLLLESGIPARSYEELLKLLEDFSN
ncbi:MAG: hypothetical protein LBS90_03010 [Oscillospiraceae bacterium]|nr:hypothetical protein [Oscillospiraceae bacterium]